MRACTVCRSARPCIKPRQPFGRPSLRVQVLSSCSSSQTVLTPRALHRRLVFTRAYLQSAVRLNQPRQASSFWSIAFLTVVISGAAIAQVIYNSTISKGLITEQPTKSSENQPQNFVGEIDTFKMSTNAIDPGHVGNLTEEQGVKLREMWVVLMKLTGIKFEGPEAAGDNTSVKNETPGSPTQEKKKSRLSFFGLRGSDNGRKSDNSAVNDTASSLANVQLSDGDDKYGQMKEFQHAIANKSPEELRETFWSMVKHDHPDALLLRFLRARKWDVHKAVVMLISTIRWRADDMHVDDDIMFGGEAAALGQSHSSDPATRKVGEDFMAQLRMGKSFIHGVDKSGRPICLIRVRLHKIGAQSEKSMERYTVHMIETAREMLPPPVETAAVIFDMTGFTLANMDYTPVKFIIKCFEANYPESLGVVLIHQAPWIFSGIWKIIKGWLDPVVAAKVHFTDSVDDLEEFISRSRILKELGGDEEYDYHYIEPQPDENDAMMNTAKRDEILAKSKELIRELEDITKSWIVATIKGDKDTAESLKTKREDVIEKTRKTYWEIDPYVRARSLYDRTGVLKSDGKVVFYPDTEEKQIESKGGQITEGKKEINRSTEEKMAEIVSAESSPEVNGDAITTT